MFLIISTTKIDYTNLGESEWDLTRQTMYKGNQAYFYEQCIKFRGIVVMHSTEKKKTRA